MGYQQYGIQPALVERVKQKMNDPAKKKAVQSILHGVGKADLQNPRIVRQLLGNISKALGIAVSEADAERITHFVLAQKIDPNNTFHLIKLWSMFR